MGLLFSATKGLAQPAYHVGASAGVAKPVGAEFGVGPALGIHVARDISSVVELRADFALSRHSFDDPDEAFDSLLVVGGLFGMSAKLDIVRWVPYANLAFGYAHFAFSPWDVAERHAGRGAVTLRGLLGMGYVLSRGTAVGVELGQSLYLQSREPRTNLAILGRFDYRWGW